MHFFLLIILTYKEELFG